MLYHLRHETDRLQLTQAALLFSWHINDGDTVSGGPWYWTGIAMRISCGQGTHRRNHSLPEFEHVIHKRTFWSAFVAEIFSALETGRPCCIRAEDVDQTLPSQEELDWDPSSTDANAQTRQVGNPVPLHYHVRMVELAYVVLDILHLNSPAHTQPTEVASIDSRLASWLLRTEGSTTRVSEYFSLLLRLHYHMVILHLHRNYSDELSGSQTTCQTAAQTIISCLEKIVALGLVKRCHFTVVSAATAAGIQIVQEIRAAVLSDTLLAALGLLDQLDQLLKCTEALAQYWPNAEAVGKVFTGLRKDYQQTVSQKLDHTETTLPELHSDWNSLFASMDIPPMGDMQNEQDWMNLTTWTDLL